MQHKLVFSGKHYLPRFTYSVKHNIIDVVCVCILLNVAQTAQYQSYDVILVL